MEHFAAKLAAAVKLALAASAARAALASAASKQHGSQVVTLPFTQMKPVEPTALHTHHLVLKVKQKRNVGA